MDQAGRTAPEVEPPRVGRGIVCRQVAHLRNRAVHVVPEHERIAVGVRLEARRFELIDRKSVLAQAQVVYHLGLQEMADVGAGGDAIAGKQLLGDTRPAHHVAPLQHQHRLPGLRQIRRCDEAVVPTTDDNGIVVRHRTSPSILA